MSGRTLAFKRTLLCYVRLVTSIWVELFVNIFYQQYLGESDSLYYNFGEKIQRGSR